VEDIPNIKTMRIWVCPKRGVQYPKMHGYKWKTLLKWMVWGENPLFSETPISKQHTVVSNHGPPPSKVKKSFSHPSFRRNKNHHDSNDELPLDQKSQLIKKTWIWMIRILGSP